MSKADDKMYEDILKKNWHDKMRGLFGIVKYHIYLLQLENYELRRYWRVVFLQGKYLPISLPWRKNIVWTSKLIILAILAAGMHLTISIFTFLHLSSFLSGIIPIIFFGAYPIFLSLAMVILWPIDYSIKNILIIRAKRKLSKFTDLKIIGIAGSYGKTTAKEVILAMIGMNKKVLATPENINTPIGIARLILKKLNSDTEVFVVEMGEYYRGDIEQICRLTSPDVAVVTGINEAHLERFRNIDNTTATIFEIVEFSKPYATIILNADDELVKENFQKFTKNKTVAWYSSNNSDGLEYTAVCGDFYEDGSGFDCGFKNKIKDLGVYRVALLGDYVKGDIVAGLQVGKVLGIDEKKLLFGLKNLKPVAHRLEPIFNQAQNILVIDDSYNGNPDGVTEALAVLNKFKIRRKVYITPGLVEMGHKAEQIHRELGRELAGVADLVILIKNSATPFIAEGLRINGFADGKIVWYDNALEAHASLGKIIKSNDVVLFQNDWGDNYV